MEPGCPGGAGGAKEKFAAFHGASSETTFQRMVHLYGRTGVGGGYQNHGVQFEARSGYFKGEAGELSSLACGIRASKDKFERMSDSTWFQTAGSHSIWM